MVCGEQIKIVWLAVGVVDRAHVDVSDALCTSWERGSSCITWCQRPVAPKITIGNLGAAKREANSLSDARIEWRWRCGGW